MNTSKITRGAITASLLLLTLAACKKKDEPAAMDTAAMTPTPTAAEPIRVSSIMTGKSIGSDKRVVTETSAFGARDTLYVSVVTEGASTGSKLTAKWTYNDGQVVDESNETISPAGGTNVTEFHLTKPSGWPKGNYKVEVMLDGASAGTKTFVVN